MQMIKATLGMVFVFGALLAEPNLVTAAPTIVLEGDWTVRVTEGAATDTFIITPPERIRVIDEKYEALPLFAPANPAYCRGVAPVAVRAQECSVSGAVITDSFVVKPIGDANVKPFVVDVDYKIDPWGTFGRLDSGAIRESTPVTISYDYVSMRLDSVVIADGKLQLLQGEPHVSIPELPKLKQGMKRVANIWLNGSMEKLEEVNLFPVLATTYPEPPKPEPPVAASLIPASWKKLQSGEKIRILAWGDSVTDASYLPDTNDRWQMQFLARLKRRFPQANIELVTEAWGGRNTAAYRNEPPGSVHNYQEKVLDAKPDLVVMEFVNDAGFNTAQVEHEYTRILNEFQAIGAEWIILTPHYVRPDWMGLTTCRDCDDDPREYVRAVRAFGAAHHVAIADAAQRYGHLWREGIPYLVLMMNNINHPNRDGMTIFADALMDLFRE